MTTRARYASARHATRRAGRRAANSPVVQFLGRLGFIARGLMYVVIGWIALLIAFGKSRQQADRTGALHELSATPVGTVALWLLVVGFFGMALWRLSEVMYDGRREGTTERPRLGALFRTVLYSVLGWGVLEYALGIGAPQSSDKQSQDLTATLLRHTGGQIAVIVVGFLLAGAGLYLAYQAWRLKFRKDMRTGEMSARTRQVVEWLGRVGGIARGIVFATAGIFLVVAAVRAQPGEAKGIDSSLRALAATPAGPAVLVLVAAGLVMFGLFSWSEARWRKL